MQAASPLLAFRTGESWSLRLIDGDRYTSSNLSRQAFDPTCVGQFKAEAQAVWIRRRFPNLDVSPLNRYFDAHSELPNGSIVALGVDNHRTRKLVSDACERVSDVTLISGGNDLIDGNVQVYIRRNEIDLTPPLGAYHPEIATPLDKAPFEMSCEELAVSAPQLIASNLMAASLMLNSLHQVLTGYYDFHTSGIELDSEFYFDISANAATGRSRKWSRQ